MSLQRAVHLAVKNNLDVRFAQLQPAISRTQITQAEAAFDAIIFDNYNHQDLDTPQPPTIGGLETFGSVQDDTRQFQTGIRKPLTTGGQFQVSTQFGRNFRDPSFFDVDTFYEANVEATLTQPLARGFGQDVVTSQISLARNARRESVEDLRGQLLTTVFQVEQTYWDLVFSRQLLLIRQRLLDRTVADRDQLKERENYDVSPVRLTEANSFVELRRADVIRSRQQVRSSSDLLKRLMNSPELPVTGEVLLVPLDRPADLPMSYSFVDAVTTALRERPELRRALLEINDRVRSDSASPTTCGCPGWTCPAPCGSTASARTSRTPTTSSRTTSSTTSCRCNSRSRSATGPPKARSASSSSSGSRPW